jgi:serine/threonine protein kinase
MPLPAGTRIGVYEVSALIGAGGMGEVYRARDARLQRDAALKVLPAAFASDAQRMARFEREARTLASLNHPNIAAIYGLEEFGPVHQAGLQVQPGPVRALVMELVEGPTLAERIACAPAEVQHQPPHPLQGRQRDAATTNAIPLDEALPIAKQIAEAVEYAHENNVIHRDLKPANIKVKADGTVKVLDFGLAKAMSDDRAEIDLANSPTLSMAATQQGIILGTAAYMSPEQAKGKAVDRRADIWAFGVILYEMLTGEQLFVGETIADTLAHVITKEVTLESIPQNVPPAVQTLLKRCLTKDVRRRLSSMSEARILLEDTIAGANEPASEEKGLRSPDKRRRDDLSYKVLAAVAILIALVLGWMQFAGRNKPEAARQLIRFRVPVDPGGNLNPVAAISPDGSSLAYFDTLPSGSIIMRIRAMDSGVVKDFPATETVLPMSLFWSPDSKTVYFGTRRILKRMDVTRGAVQQVCECGADAGTVNQEGIVLVTSFVNDNVSQISPKGDATVVQKGARPEFASFLPDGKRYLFMQTDTGGVFLASLDQPQAAPRHLADSSLRFSLLGGPGESFLLVAEQNGDVQALPFDTDKAEITGPAVVVPIAQWRNNMPPSVSNNGILVNSFQARASAVIPVWFDRTGRRLENAAPAGAYGTVDLSPDAGRLLSQLQPDGSQDISLWLRDLARGTSSRLLPNAGRGGATVWAPDGLSVVLGIPNAKGKAQIVRVDASNVRPPASLLANEAEPHWPNDWSRDGKYLLYSRERQEATDLWVLPMDRTDAKPMQYSHAASGVRHGQAQFSPDGRFVAYNSDESGRYDIYVQPFPDASKGKWVISQGGGFEPRWSRDGRELFFFSGQKLMVADVKGSGDSFSASAPRELFTAPVPGGYTGDSHRWQVSSDGKRFLLLVPTTVGSGAYLDVLINWESLLKR